MKKMIAWIKKLFEKKPKPEPVDQFPDDIDPKEIKWLGVNVGAWKKTSDLKISYTGSEIIYDQTITNTMPVVIDGKGKALVGNPWIMRNRDGQWYAATHEFMKRNDTRRGKNTLDDDHIERREFQGWAPQIGERVGHCVSGLCRGNWRNVQERTKITEITWR